MLINPFSMASGAATSTVGAATKEIRLTLFDEPHHHEEGVESRRAIGGTSPSQRLTYHLKKVENRLVQYSLEARGIERVQEDERIPHISWVSYLQVFLLWMSVNLAANNITLGMLGPAVYGLSYLDSALCAVFGALLGSISSSWMATWGPISGIRTMAFGRYTMGWWPSKLIVILNLIQMIGYCLINCVVCGQILSAVSPNGTLSVAVGIVIIAVISWIIATFGIKVFHYYERFAFLPQIIVISILFGVSSSKVDLSTPSHGDTRTVIGNRISFFSLCVSAAITYTPLAADFFVYYPVRTSKLKLFSLSILGLLVSFTLAFLCGIGLASSINIHPEYAAAYNDGQGALIVQGFSSLHTFGNFCSVIVALGLIANTIAPTYSAGVDFQTLGRYAEKVPRAIWNTFGVVIYTVCALAGRSHLADIFTNFLALMGYFVAIWVAIVLEECFIFRRRGIENGYGYYNWLVWNDPSKHPVGIAALIAFLTGWAGAILCMAQVWYIGPLANLVGEYGADMGNYVGFSWAAIVYPPLRYLERKQFGR
ncbi:purine-cytosine permease family protein [Aspergillus foveolatus]|uniref:purine-cytosine permease family protein n=1 Tax=Aspergillus foveolatus TaxID=210207 RepID=UPI003CCDE706